MNLIDAIKESRGENPELTSESPELTKEAQDDITKYATDMTEKFIKMRAAHDEISKQANEVVGEMSEEDLEKSAEFIAFGRGLAYGEKIASEKSIDEHYQIFIDKVAEVTDEEFALRLHNAFLEKGGEEAVADAPKESVSEEAEIVGAAAEAAVEKLVEEVGGEEAVKKDPELAEEIIQAADAIGEQVKEDIKAMAKEPAEKPAETASEET